MDSEGSGTPAKSYTGQKCCSPEQSALASSRLRLDVVLPAQRQSSPRQRSLESLRSKLKNKNAKVLKGKKGGEGIIIVQPTSNNGKISNMN